MKKYILLNTAVLLFFPLAYGQGLEWVKQMPNASSPSGTSIVVDKHNYIYSTGSFASAVDFDLGVGTAIVSASGTADIYIQKLREDGTLVWVKRMGGSGSASGNAIAVDEQGNIYLTGQFTASVDFDPGPGTNTLFATGDADAFILKMDRNGQLIWVKKIGGSLKDNGLAIAVDTAGNVYTTGWFTGTADFDPGTNTFSLSSIDNSWDRYVEKLDAAGNFVWAVRSGDDSTERGRGICCSRNGEVYVTGDDLIQKLDVNGNELWSATMTNSSSGTCMVTDADDNIYVTGYVGSDIQLPDTVLHSPLITSSTFILHLDPDGHCINCQILDCSIYAWGFSIALDAVGNAYITGSLMGDADFDPGPGVAMLSSPDEFSAYLLKLDAAGNFAWATLFQSSGVGNAVQGLSSAVTQNGSVFTVGSFHGTNDFDPSSGTLNLTSVNFSDRYIAKLATRLYYQGLVFQDLNANDVREPGEPGLYKVLVKAHNHDAVASTDASGAYRFYTDLGQDTLRMVIPKSYWSVSPDFVLADSTQPNHDFAVVIAPVRDICISATEVTRFQAGFDNAVVISVSNVGSLAVDSIPVVLTIVTQPNPGELVYLSSTPTAFSQSGNLLTWLIGTLAVGETTNITIHFRTPPEAAFNSPIFISTSAYISNDIYPANNGSRLSTFVRGAYDPNDKQVTPSILAPAQLDTTALSYVVRFQNTGNFPANMVIIRDTLPAGLDLTTLQVLGASHPHTWRLYGDRILEVRFDPIALPDSNANEPASHGFVTFSMRTKKGLVLGDSISNRAGIYFDYNAPVITEAAVFRVNIPLSLTASGFSERLDFGLHPNPVASNTLIAVDLPASLLAREKEIMVSTMDGKKMQEISLKPGEQRVLLNGLPAGVYLVQIRTVNLFGAKLLVVH